MKFFLLTFAMLTACLSTGCVVEETVTEHAEVVSEGYKVKEPFHKQEDATR